MSESSPSPKERELSASILTLSSGGHFEHTLIIVSNWLELEANRCISYSRTKIVLASICIHELRGDLPWFCALLA